MQIAEKVKVIPTQNLAGGMKIVEAVGGIKQVGVMREATAMAAQPQPPQNL